MPEVRTKELAEAAGVHLQRVYQWGKEGLDASAKLRRGWYDRDRALAWIDSRRMVNQREPTVVNDPTAVTVTAEDVIYERLRVLRSQADGNELRNDRLRGNSLNADVVIALFAELEAIYVTEIDRWAREGKTAREISDRTDLAFALRARISAAENRLQALIDDGEDLSAARIRES